MILSFREREREKENLFERARKREPFLQRNICSFEES